MTGWQPMPWLMDHALPVWAGHGVDWACGGFHERLTFTLAPVMEPHRARLTARQIYCFATGHALGWDGPARMLVDHGLDFLHRHLITAYGHVRPAHDFGTVQPSNAVSVGSAEAHDTYDDAFVLFALAVAAGEWPDLTGLEPLARRIALQLSAGWVHPLGGYYETAERLPPLRSNPHMHLFEAFLEWLRVSDDADGFWRARARDIADLALGRMLLDTGAIPELFGLDWRALEDDDGILVEPGHQFEWGWLLARWSRLSGEAAPFTAAVRLIRIGEGQGVNPARGVAVLALRADGSFRDAGAKLWPQTERVKAWHELSCNPRSDGALRQEARQRRALALDGIATFLVAPPVAPLGLWREVMRPDGSFVDEPVRASSFYHIVCAIHTISERTPWVPASTPPEPRT